MKKFLLRMLVNIVAFYIAWLAFPQITLHSSSAAVLAGFILTIVNLSIRPLLILIMFPINLLTLGLFTLVVNTWMVMLADFFVPGMKIPGFGLAFVTALIISVLNLVAFHRK